MPNPHDLAAFNPATGGRYDPGPIQVFYDNRSFGGFQDKLPFYQKYKLDALSRIGRPDLFLPQDLTPGYIRLVWYTHTGTRGTRDFPLHKSLAVHEMFTSLSADGFRPMIYGYAHENPFPMLGGVVPAPPPKKKDPAPAKTWSNFAAGHSDSQGTPHDRVMAIIRADEEREAKERAREVGEMEEKGRGGEGERLV